jgi:hypothetical protein
LILEIDLFFLEKEVSPAFVFKSKQMFRFSVFGAPALQIQFDGDITVLLKALLSANNT